MILKNMGAGSAEQSSQEFPAPDITVGADDVSSGRNSGLRLVEPSVSGSSDAGQNVDAPEISIPTRTAELVQRVLAQHHPWHLREGVVTATISDRVLIEDSEGKRHVYIHNALTPKIRVASELSSVELGDFSVGTPVLFVPTDSGYTFLADPLITVSKSSPIEGNTEKL